MDANQRTFVILAPESAVRPTAGELEAALVAAGWTRWAGNSDPLIAVVHNASGKGDFFEAGVWAGRRVQVFFLGGTGARFIKRKQIVGRFGGWAAVGDNNRATVADFMAALGRWERELA